MEAIAENPVFHDGQDLNACSIDAVVRSIRSYGDDGFVILDLGGKPPRTAVGESVDGEISAGVAYRFYGTWINHDKYGPQFKFDSAVLSQRQEQMGVIAYLSRSALGLSAALAKRLWNAFGADAISVLRMNPDRAATEAQIDQAKAVAASVKLRDMMEFEPTKIELFELFSGRGFPKSVVKSVIAKWGKRAPEIIRRDPFKMLVADISGVGFKRADRLYIDLGGNPLRLKRQTLAAWHALHTSSTGNTWDSEGLCNKAVMQATGMLDYRIFARAIELGVRSRWIQRRDDDGTKWYAEKVNARNEELLAVHIRRIMKHKPMWPTIPENSPATPHQREKLAEITGSALGILAGTPGTGKTFTAAVLLRELIALIGAHRIAVCAPTGKAAVRITEAMARYELPLTAFTIHGTLGVSGYGANGYVFEHNEENRLPYDVILADEMSMTDTDLASALFRAIKPGANVLLVGDPFQLPPVGHGAPLRDMIDAGVPCGLLTEIKRNSGAIVTACRDIKDGRLFTTSPRIDVDAGENLAIATAETKEQQRDVIVSHLDICRGKLYDPIWDVQILTATNDKGPVSRKPLNILLQSILNPVVTDLPAERKNAAWRVGDKVICLKNVQSILWELGWNNSARDLMESWQKTANGTYLANGDMGRVEAVSPTDAVVTFNSPERTVKIATGRKKKNGNEQGDGVDNNDGGNDSPDKIEFDLAYAVTVHKSQGSEWPVVIVVVDEGAGPLGTREFIYTAISRAAKLCILVGQRATALKWARKVSLSNRKTFLKEMIIS